jgi:hypothetical protein
MARNSFNISYLQISKFNKLQYVLESGSDPGVEPVQVFQSQQQKSDATTFSVEPRFPEIFGLPYFNSFSTNGPQGVQYQPLKHLTFS